MLFFMGQLEIKLFDCFYDTFSLKVFNALCL